MNLQWSKRHRMRDRCLVLVPKDVMMRHMKDKWGRIRGMDRKGLDECVFPVGPDVDINRSHSNPIEDTRLFMGVTMPDRLRPLPDREDVSRLKVYPLNLLGRKSP